MKSVNVMFIVGLLVISIIGVVFLGDKNGPSSLPEAIVKGEMIAETCKPIDIAIDRSNSVHGLKEGKFFAYVDLATMAHDLACHSDDNIKAALIANVTSVADDWWKKDRFQVVNEGEIHIITILDKDEYARASFDSAQLHGQIKLTRKDGIVTFDSENLTFDNMRASIK